MYDQSQTEKLSADVASGGRFRYEGTGWRGSGLIVSDGTYEWRLRRSFAQYEKKPPGTFFASRPVLAGDDGVTYDAKTTLDNLKALGNNLHSAHFGGAETLQIGQQAIHCVTIRYSIDDVNGRHGQKDNLESTLWIDPTSLKLWKRVDKSHNTLWFGNGPAPFGPVLDNMTVTEFSAVELDFDPGADVFSFKPPLDSKEVAALPPAFPQSESKDSSATKAIVDAHIGKPLGPIVLRDSERGDVPLSRYLGHPLLIDLWATWCGPCIGELPTLNRIRKSTAQTDLKMLAIDEDYQTNVTAVGLLKRKGYDWEDFHYNKSVTTELATPGIPLMVLVDSTGKVVYYHSGDDDAPGLVKAITALGEAYAVVTIDK